MSSVQLTNTSYAVLGLVRELQPATPYVLKNFAQQSVFHFWSLPHTQMYSECARMAAAGYLSEERELTGRRRRVYSLTDAGRSVLEVWCADPSGELYELRDIGLLKLFLGGDPAALAESQVTAHQERLQAFEQLHANYGAKMPLGQRLALEGGINHERQYIELWGELQK